MSTSKQKSTPPVPPVEKQDGPPPLVEELVDTDDFPQGEDEPEQTTESDADLEEEPTS